MLTGAIPDIADSADLLDGQLGDQVSDQLIDCSDHDKGIKDAVTPTLPFVTLGILWLMLGAY